MRLSFSFTTFISFNKDEVKSSNAVGADKFAERKILDVGAGLLFIIAEFLS